ncbi:E3 ubiquitin-protein ligase TRIP12 [Dermatophagoides farinae]|uniref:E3 ubiquitin-protein ligase TRIP12 n=1 Tax=Dermatophagoides farinae TaxID=6954 RepID=UPI003F5F12E7
MADRLLNKAPKKDQGTINNNNNLNNNNKIVVETSVKRKKRLLKSSLSTPSSSSSTTKKLSSNIVVVPSDHTSSSSKESNNKNNNKDKSRSSPVITRSRSRNISEISCFHSNSSSSSSISSLFSQSTTTTTSSKSDSIVVIEASSSSSSLPTAITTSTSVNKRSTLIDTRENNNCAINRKNTAKRCKLSSSLEQISNDNNTNIGNSLVSSKKRKVIVSKDLSTKPTTTTTTTACNNRNNKRRVQTKNLKLKTEQESIDSFTEQQQQQSSSSGILISNNNKTKNNRNKRSTIETKVSANKKKQKTSTSDSKNNLKKLSTNNSNETVASGGKRRAAPSSSIINRIVMEQNGSNFSNANINNSSSSQSTNNGNSNETNTTAAHQLNPPGTSAILNTYAMSSPTDNDTEESDMNRLQTILESRALQQHFLGIPRMQNLFYRSFSSSSNTKAQQLLNGLNSAANDSEKLHYVLEMCQILLMGNEDTLVGFPIKAVVPTLINLLSMEHNFEIMHHACRALTYMMESLPRSSIAVLDAIPVFLEKLQVIQCMDVAEQSLSALEMLSRRHNKSILHARGVSACLTYLDFFSIDAQRSALNITANCFQNLSPDDFQYVQDSLSILGSHLTIEDKKCIESICLAFYRLVECYQNDCVIISEIASRELLTNIQNVLMTKPPILSTGPFVNVIRMLSIMCLSCSQIAVELLKLNICETLKCLLLCGENNNNNNVKEKNDEMNLISRSPQEICELTAFIAELMPSLPSSGIFSIDTLFSKSNLQSSEVAIWQWKDDRGLWQAFNVVDNKIIESAHQSGEDELELASLNRTYIVDFNSMQKICEDTGNSYAIQRKTNTFTSSELHARNTMQTIDPRSEFIYNEHRLSSNFIKFVFKVLYEVYNNSAGYSVRYKCLNAILRIIYYAPRELMISILEDQSISSSIATMLASQDLRIVVCAVQMCNIFMEKLPDIFSIFFQREGVIHQIRKLYSDETRFIHGDNNNIKSLQLLSSSSRDMLMMNNNNNNKTPLSSTSGNNTGSSIVYTNSPMAILENAQMILNRTASESISAVIESSLMPTNFSSQTHSNTNQSSKSSSSSSSNNKISQQQSVQNSDQLSSGRNEENSRRKRTRKSIPVSGSRNLINYEHSSTNENNGNNTTTTSDNDLNICSSLSTTYLNNLPFLMSETINGANLNMTAGAVTATNNHSSKSNSSSSTRLGSSSKDFLQRLNPTRWARWTQNSVNPNSNVIPTTSNVTAIAKEMVASTQKSSNSNKDKIKSWIKEQGKIFDDKYFLKTDANEKESHLSSNILADLNQAINLLKQDSTKGLLSIKNILMDSDLSSFELIHSGLVANLFSFLTINTTDNIMMAENNLRTFLLIFIGAPKSEMAENIDQLNFDTKPMAILVNKLNACVSQLEQFPVRVQDYAVHPRSSHAFKMINSHLLKISLNRHPSCTNLKKYKGPLIKLDPFTTVHAIERYLLAKGYGRIKDSDDDQSDDDLSDDDTFDINLSSSSQMQTRHRLQLLIHEHVLPYNISLYQVIKQFMSNDNIDNDGGGGDDGHHHHQQQQNNSKFWGSTFPIYYRLSTDANTLNASTTNSSVSSSSNNINNNNNGRSRSKSKSKTSANKKKDELWLEGRITKNVSPLEPYIRNNITINVNANDQSVEVIALLRVLYGINRYWGHLYKFSHIYNPAIPLKEFTNNKLTVKANRQLQDPVVIMTGGLPNWLSELAYACPFMFPFEIRYLLFYVVCFDRDRALYRLFENTQEFSSSDNRERFLTPRLEKRRKLISRNEIFRSAETLFNDVSNSKSMLEIQYENEVGTGLGPTLEFYALVSKEFQRAEFEMWRGEVLTSNIKNEKPDNFVNYINSNYGLFPAPIGRNTKPSISTKIKHRFKLLGKFMAKALMDFRMIDINLNIIFYKWVLCEELTLSVSDLYHLDYTFFSSISQMYKIAQRKSKMNVNSNSELLKLQGSSIEDLNIDFIMPGYPNIELRKGGKDMAVTLNNLENYIELVSCWSLMEGVTKQMEAFKEGFNSVFELSRLKLFYPEELQQLFCGSGYKSWDPKTLMESCKIDHGFTHESRAIKFLFEILSSYNAEEQRKFLQFLTGFPRLPIGGFKSLNPPFTIVKKNPTESDNPNCLPSVMTCVNYLKLPDYPTVDIMREKLNIAISEGQFSFHLS